MGEPMPPPIPRPTARVLVVDRRERVLLFGCQGEGPYRDQMGWTAPGGAVDAGETLQEAAARELGKETGLAVSPDQLGPVVAHTWGHWRDGRGRTYLGTDNYFFLRVTELTVDTSGQSGYERATLLGHRWWSLPELRATTEIVLPLELAALMQRLLQGDIPTEPVVLPWWSGN